MNERDWTQLNAHADGELGPDDADMLSARLDRERALAAEFERILALKDRLAGLAANPSRRGGDMPTARAPVAILALAASLLVAGLVGFAMVDRTADPQEPGFGLVVTLHSDFSARSYPEHAAVVAVAPPGQVTPPDLSGSNLRLVASWSETGPAAGAIGYHYRGPRGCRVTLVIGPSLELLRGEALVRQWEAQNRMMVLVADGMDPLRFAAVADYAEAATRGHHPDDRLRIAVEERTAAARPCA